MIKIIQFFNTIKYLKVKQVYYRSFYFLRDKFFNKQYEIDLNKKLQPIIWNDFLFNQKSYYKNNCFNFLNREYCFNEQIDWNYLGYGKLWTFNLNYFDFLNQEDLSREEGLKLIKGYICNDKILKDGKESYTISLRGINWIKFLSKHKIINQEINQALYNHYQRLLDNLELQFLGNHYLENGFSLLFGACYFQDEELLKVAKKIVMTELEEQVLVDGGHLELSPMYHQTMLHRVLDCINLIKNNTYKEDKELFSFLKEKAEKMLSWLQAVIFKNYNIPMVNDSTYNIAPTSKDLFDYATFLGLYWKEGKLSDSGYRKVQNNNYELFIDVGNVGAYYLPAHIHSDTFNFELYINNTPIVVDTGVSTYEKNSLRQLQRSTESHNTVKIGDVNQSKVWSGFRVAERAKIVSLKESENKIEATHNGFKNLKILHTRRFITNENEIIIEDILSKDSNNKAKAFLHFYPGINISIEENSIMLLNYNVSIIFSEDIYNIKVSEYDYALGFNKTEKAEIVEISFNKKLKTFISL